MGARAARCMESKRDHRSELRGKVCSVGSASHSLAYTEFVYSTFGFKVVIESGRDRIYCATRS